MMKPIRSRLTFANVVSLLALFAALSLGTAWAVERNSVRSKHIVNDQVKPADIAAIKALQNTGDLELPDNNGDSVASERDFASARGFEFTGRCLDDGSTGDNTATILVESKDPDATWSFDSTADNGDDDQASLTGTARATLIKVGPADGEHFEGGSWALRSSDGSGRGKSLQGFVSASIETADDCTFALTIVG